MGGCPPHCMPGRKTQNLVSTRALVEAEILSLRVSRPIDCCRRCRLWSASTFREQVPSFKNKAYQLVGAATAFREARKLGARGGV